MTDRPPRLSAFLGHLVPICTRAQRRPGARPASHRQWRSPTARRPGDIPHRTPTRNRPQPWTVDELAAWLRVALTDRFAALWLLAATSGMRRSELAGADRELLDLNAATLSIEDTRLVVAGQTVDSDGKLNSGVRTISLDGFTVELLGQYLARHGDPPLQPPGGPRWGASDPAT